MNLNYSQIRNLGVIFCPKYTFYMFTSILFILLAFLGSMCPKMGLVSLLSLTKKKKDTPLHAWEPDSGPTLMYILGSTCMSQKQRKKKLNICK